MEKKGNPDHKFQFQGQEKQEEFGLNWSSFKWRNADVQLGRFHSVDSLADKYVYNSPYAFAENKVPSYGELEGLETYFPPSVGGNQIFYGSDSGFGSKKINLSAEVKAKIIVGSIGLDGDFIGATFGGELTSQQRTLIGGEIKASTSEGVVPKPELMGINTDDGSQTDTDIIGGGFGFGGKTGGELKRDKDNNTEEQVQKTEVSYGFFTRETENNFTTGEQRVNYSISLGQKVAFILGFEGEAKLTISFQTKSPKDK